MGRVGQLQPPTRTRLPRIARFLASGRVPKMKRVFIGMENGSLVELCQAGTPPSPNWWTIMRQPTEILDNHRLSSPNSVCRS